MPKALLDKVLSRGNIDDPFALFKDFYGRVPEVCTLLEASGLKK
jgi:Zn-dependent oligopeptidase